MAVLYLTEQRSIVRKTSDRLIVEKDHEVLLEVPCLKLDTVLIFGNVQVTTQALIEMLDHGIELAYLSLSGKLRGQLTPPKARNVPLRMRQYDLARSEAPALSLAKRLVGAKIATCWPATSSKACWTPWASIPIWVSTTGLIMAARLWPWTSLRNSARHWWTASASAFSTCAS
jgi:CRISPR-associated endonuclease Cas1